MTLGFRNFHELLPTYFSSFFFKYVFPTDAGSILSVLPDSVSVSSGCLFMFVLVGSGTELRCSSSSKVDTQYDRFFPDSC